MKVQQLIEHLEDYDSDGDYEVVIEDMAHVPDDFQTGKSIVKVGKIRWDHNTEQCIIEVEVE